MWLYTGDSLSLSSILVLTLSNGTHTQSNVQVRIMLSKTGQTTNIPNIEQIVLCHLAVYTMRCNFDLCTNFIIA